jgi:uncharacterized protein DUF3551
MRNLSLALALVALAMAPRAALAQGAWCSEDMNARNCGFYTLEQCRAAASGLGAGCYPNQFYSGTRTVAAEPRKRHRRIKHTH